MIIYRKSIILILFVVTMSLMLSGCRTGHQTEITKGTYWYESQNVIQTNDLQRLQKKVPFSIIFPGYLPADIDASQNPGLIMMPDSNASNDIKIEIVYRNVKSTVDRIIKIDEINSPNTWLPNEDMEYTYLNYSGITVLEQKGMNSLAGGPLVTALYYGWSQNGIAISVITFAFEQDEAHKIVESMIK